MVLVSIDMVYELRDEIVAGLYKIQSNIEITKETHQDLNAWFNILKTEKLVFGLSKIMRTLST